jgi:hypothetical protein
MVLGMLAELSAEKSTAMSETATNCIHRMIMVCFCAPAENVSFGGGWGLH